ncbi:Outer membrane protein [Legionella londiniensis]|uniref:Outer membrane efflux protein n=2 Tax=Legionella londiniensis TaxID=45068 RepID=A0A0W0VI38_9GAMM|nr:outer membrane efflux protein [Legionella londiniensis]STX92298.1 Outer membrane protein [Legionella londiniensis]
MHLLLGMILTSFSLQAANGHDFAKRTEIPRYHWADNPEIEKKIVDKAQEQLCAAIKNPEYMLNHWIELPASPKSRTDRLLYLSLREAILLALRYNPNILNAELDRIIQRYQLRLANNEFELQYALAGTSLIQKSRYQGVGNTTTEQNLITPELSLKTRLGGQLSLRMDNNVAVEGNYNPLLNFSFTQPLLNGFGREVNEASLRDAEDNEWLNKLNLQQAVMDQITQVISAYRALILSGNNLQNQKRQLKEAQKTYEINEKKIKAGQLEPTANIQQSYQIESLSLMVEQAENEFRNTAQDLLLTIGLDPDMKLAVPSDVQLEKTFIPDVDEAIKQALAHNTQYLALKMAVRANERAYVVAKNKQLWQLDLRANVQTGSITDVNNPSPGISGIYNGRNITESAGVTLTIPIRDISRRSQLIAAKVRLEKSRLNLIAGRRALITTIKNTINSIESQAKRYELAKRQVYLAEQSYALEKKKQQAGIASALDVSNTQNQLLLAQMGLINAKIAYLNQISALQRILGTTLEHWQIKLRCCG